MNDDRMTRHSATHRAAPKITRRAAVTGMAVAAALGPAHAAAKTRAIRPGAIWRDNNGVHINAHGGGILRVAGRFYWYGEHKGPGPQGSRAHVGVRVYSSTNLVDWRNEGVALAVVSDPASPIIAGCTIERPKVLYNRRTGKFVMWFHLELKGQGYRAAQAAVAVADNPLGPFTFLRAGRVLPGVWPRNVTREDRTDTKLARDFAGGQMARDQTVFVDQDEVAWHVYASEDNQTLHAAQLTEDYLSHNGAYWRLLPDGRNEAPAIFFAKGRYYMVASGLTGWAPNPARSYVADRISGPWTALGNPVRGTAAQAATTYGAQSTFVLPIDGECGAAKHIFMADVWRPEDHIDARYLWLPIEWEREAPVLRWKKEWYIDG